MPDHAIYTVSQGLEKVKFYCAYQERCHNEVKKKLYNLGLEKKEVETVVTILIEEGVLNEERFAIAFAGGKFRINQWGKQKIKYALKQKHISDYCIRQSLALISEESYQKVFATIANKKLQSLKNEKNILIRKRKIQDYLLQKGFERNLISEWLKALKS